MDYIAKYKLQIAFKTFLAVFMVVTLTIGSWIVAHEFTSFSYGQSLGVSMLVGLASTTAISFMLAGAQAKPVQKIDEIIGFAAHSNRGGTPPELTDLHMGRELIAAQSRQIYELAETSSNTVAEENPESVAPSNSQGMLDGLHIPIIGIDGDHNVTLANQAAVTYLNKPMFSIVGKPLFDSLTLSFQSDETLDEWLKHVKESSVTSERSWDRVRHDMGDEKHKQFDLSASFSSESSSGTDTMLAIFDRTDRYNTDDKEVSYVALAVHELRTPLTIMRGYIEVFEDELGPTLTPELAEFMHKMHASAQQLTAFVSNILNVARIEEDQLSIKLRKEDLAEILQVAVADLELRAQVYGKHLDLRLEANLPPIAVDRTSLHEVINNLVDNAIKYSDKSENINISAWKNDEGRVEVSVTDFGIGIPRSVMSELFQKFHRSHKSKVQVGGTGLGLYLCKALVNAMGGNIWVKSKEGEGSTFSFTILPYDQITDAQAAGEDGIIRGAHGWIKNHSMYRN
ncbi:MAG: signal transduction histidine kinase [Candidatus Saccharimonadales bacterium]|jgi:signal transduction histidine kinase